MQEYAGKVNAPEFPEGLEWFNTSRPLRMRDLRGKIVLLDFWTFCCINCMHVLADLKRLEEKYPQELVVVGVHSAKFSAERFTQNVRQAVLRYEIQHPVVNDPALQLWRQYGIRAWPTVVLLDPQGKVVGGHSGEGVWEVLDPILPQMIASFDAQGLMARDPIEGGLERAAAPRSVLSFPGKVLADESGERLFIADSNHNRIVIAGLLDGAIQEVIGRGDAGFQDADFDSATFFHPNGMALAGDVLYIADTENHAIRKAQLSTRQVETVAGTGKQSRAYPPVAGPARQTELNSPWDLVVLDDCLYIAMAGAHQLWKLDLRSGQVGPFAGSGREARVDGPLPEAALAQPSGITTDGQRLFFADSETSSIRFAELTPGGWVRTIVGEDLFEFGDQDGAGPAVRLQHPLGVVYHGGCLYIADTYNNKIKRVFPATRVCVALAGTGQGGLLDGAPGQFDEPAGLAVAHGKLYVADTNNHAVRVVDLDNGKVSAWPLQNLARLAAPPKQDAFSGRLVRLGTKRVPPGKGVLEIALQLPADYKLNQEAPNLVELSVQDPGKLSIAGNAQKSFEQPDFPLRVPYDLGEGSAALRVDLTLYYCNRDQEALCLLQEGRMELTLEPDGAAAPEPLSLVYDLT